MGLFSTNNMFKNFSNHLALEILSNIVPEYSIFGILGAKGADSDIDPQQFLLLITTSFTFFFPGTTLLASKINRTGIRMYAKKVNYREL